MRGSALLLIGGLALGVALLAPPKAGLAEEPAQPELRPRRLYFGAPPGAPHDLGPDMAECLACHGEPGSGGPQTPHPERLRCQQCHVSAAEEPPPFHENRFVSLGRPGREARVQPNGPPMIPHPVLLRENCLACHAPGAREDVIATPHPERLRCQQCHLPQQATVATFPAREEGQR
jgi:cytochrome c-type protein NapB